MSDSGPFWEHFTVGEISEISGRALTKQEIVDYAKQYDPQPFHLDEEAAKKSLLGGLSASGWHSCAYILRLVQNAEENCDANYGVTRIEEVRWRAPVRPGDAFNTKQSILDVTDDPEHENFGLVRQMLEVRNQDDNVLVTMDAWFRYAKSEGTA